MGSAASYHEPEAAVRHSETLARPLREKLLALDYRVRKLLDRHANDRSDDEEGDDTHSRHVVAYHNEGVPESLSRMLNVLFTVNIDDVNRASKDGWSNTHSLTLEPPAVQLPDEAGDIPRVRVGFFFSVKGVVPSCRIISKQTIGSKGLRSLAVSLQMRVETHEEGEEDLHDLEQVGQWEASGCTAFATSPAFLDGVDAEAEGEGHLIEPKRWWNEKEHRRQQAQEQLNYKVLHPEGPCAKHINRGCTILDLCRCERLPTDASKSEPWWAPGASRSSTESVWGLLGERPKQQFATPFGRRCLPVVSRTSSGLDKVKACQEIACNIAAFVLEPVRYQFQANVYFGVGLANF
eukprot:gnl/TRDRNA2_/TRDRNA2_144028_c0_seq1.p1 gnl/TRDRNA2_/TRDRNA2_144028_c0~~gnl/TRDRNA2_/TRDRNA2_144028_c0_seq1.p1  ORF type:complete len:350 (-),score=46.93 gnl/TRDRNA2_/TRDRNA2_144028_c0_seq1:193-1242(-)